MKPVIRSLPVIALLSVPSVALAQDSTDTIASGEFDGTAHTLRKGEHQIHLNSTYKYGIVDGFQVGTNVGTWFLLAPELSDDDTEEPGVMLAGAANVQLEGTVWDNENMALSVGSSANVFYKWENPYAVYLNVLYTLGAETSNRFNVGLSYGYRNDSFDFDDSGAIDEWEVETFSELPIELSYDWVLKDGSTVRGLFHTDPLAFGRLTGRNGDRNAGWFTVYGGWHKGWEYYRLALGMMLTSRGISNVQEITDFMANYPKAPQFDTPNVMPLPYVRMWWTF